MIPSTPFSITVFLVITAVLLCLLLINVMSYGVQVFLIRLFPKHYGEFMPVYLTIATLFSAFVTVLHYLSWHVFQGA